MWKGFFITGTDTDIGKTYVSRLLCRVLADQGPVTYCKPVQTGCTRGAHDVLKAPDYESVKPVCSVIAQNEALHVPYCFEPACSPHLAANQANTTIDIGVITHALAAVARLDVVRIVEGAGGIMVPLGNGHTMRDLMQALNLPVVLLTTPRLGTLNHTLLSIEALTRSSLSLAGVVCNNFDCRKEDFIFRDNIATIRQAVAPLPFCLVPGNGTPDSVRSFCNEILLQLG